MRYMTSIIRKEPPRNFVYNRAMKIPTRGLKAILLACVAGASVLYAQGASQSGGWETCSGEAQGRRYSPLTQINTTNVSRLKLAWQYGVARASAGSTVSAAGRSQAVPILVRGVLVVAVLSVPGCSGQSDYLAGSWTRGCFEHDRDREFQRSSDACRLTHLTRRASECDSL
jgi:hypothetical protein